MEQQGLGPKATIMDAAAMGRALTRIAHEVIENNEGAENLADRKSTRLNSSHP